MSALPNSSEIRGAMPPSGAGGGTPDGTIEVSDLWLILVHRRLLILATIVSFCALAILYGLITPASYSATTQILIDPRDRQVMSNDVNNGAVAPDGGITQAESQARVIESNAVLLRAITATGLQKDPEFNSSGLISRLLGTIGLGSASEPSSESSETRTLIALRQRLSVRRADKVLVLEVTVTTREAEKSKRIANAIADAYLADQNEAKSNASRRASAEITARLAGQKKRVLDSENALEKFKTENDLVASTGQLLVEQQLTEASTQLGAAKSRTAALRAQVEQLNGMKKSGQGNDSNSEAIRSSVVGALREQEGTLVQQESDLRSQYGPRHPKIFAVEDQLRGLRVLIANELSRVEKATREEYDRALRNEELISKNLDALKQKAVGASQVLIRFRELQRELEANRSVYATYLVRAQETNEQSNVETLNARVISQAMAPPNKSGPSLALLLFGGLCAGTGFGICLALGAEYLNPTIRSTEQAQRASNASSVVMMQTAPSTAPGGSTAVADLSARTRDSIDLTLWQAVKQQSASNRKGAVLKIVVTSDPKDARARARCAKVMALAAADRGERVLFMDAAYLGRGGVANGLFDIVRGAKTLSDVIHPDEQGGISIVAPGIWTQLGRAEQSRLQQFYIDAHQRFDLLIIDGGALTENHRVATFVESADALILVARVGETSQRDLAAVRHAASAMGGPVASVMLVEEEAVG